MSPDGSPRGPGPSHNQGPGPHQGLGLKPGAGPPAGAAWQALPERGSDTVNRLFLAVARRLGRGPARLAVPVASAYFTLAVPTARQASADYLARVRPGPVRLRDVWRHIGTFGAVTLDRAFLGFDPRRFDLRVHGSQNLTERLGPGRPGLILLLAHVGSFEALRAVAAQVPLPPVRLVMDREHGRQVLELLEEVEPGLKASIIDARHPALALAVGEAVARGEVVGLMADRLTPGDAGVEVPFLGATCRLPAGPWLLAAALKVPVVMALGLPRGGRRYDLYFETLAERLALPRRERAAHLAAHVAAYARRLEHHLAGAPYSWANFFPFFADAVPPPAPEAGGEPRAAPPPP